MRHDEIPNITDYSVEELKEQFHIAFDEMTTISKGIEMNIMMGNKISHELRLAYDNSVMVWNALNEELSKREMELRKNEHL